jgi:hypothetical protein
MNLSRCKNLELLIGACCGLISEVRDEIRSARIPAAKMFLCRYLLKEAYFPDARPERDQESKEGTMEDPTTTEDIMIAPSVRETASEDGAALLDIEQGMCFSLNPVGLKIWGLVKTHHSVDEIADELAQDFPVSRSQLLSDVAEFLQSLEAKKLIRRSGHSAPTRSWLSRILPWANRRHNST